MHYLSVGAVFKNESAILREWLEHYILHDVDHFYLIDDHSTDDVLSVLQPYIDCGKVTLFKHTSPWKYYLGRQKDMYNHFILPKLQETKWLLMVDLDEYMWSPISTSLKIPLRQCEHLGQIQVKHTLFGSNGHVEQPKSVVESFIKRSAKKADGNIKYFINTAFAFKELTIHHAFFQNKSDEERYFLILDEPYFRLNHYSSQSRKYWDENKCVRGDGDHWRTRTPEDFLLVDCNEVEDLELYLQNRECIDRLLNHKTKN
jgi:hypothetical protein